MAALKEIARDVASEIRDGIGWVIVYRTGRSWHSVTLYSDLGNNEWETDDINDALEALRLDPRAVALNGYYLGRFGDMTIEDIAAGIRYHYERGTNALADDDILTQARADIEAARQQVAEAGLPFSERLVDGPEDEPNPYAYDGSMTVADYEAAQRARDAHAALVEVVADPLPQRHRGGRRARRRGRQQHEAQPGGRAADPRRLRQHHRGHQPHDRVGRSGHQDARGLLRRDARQLHTAPGPAQVAPLRPPCEAGPRPQEIPQPHPAGLLRCAGFGGRWELVKFKCVGCGLYWNVSIYQQIPRGGYICPHCESRLRAGETLPNQRPGQNDRPQTTKGAKP